MRVGGLQLIATLGDHMGRRYHLVYMICTNPKALFWSVLLSCIFSAARACRADDPEITPARLTSVGEGFSAQHVRAAQTNPRSRPRGSPAWWRTSILRLGYRYYAPNPATARIDDTNRRCLLLTYVQADIVSYSSTSDVKPLGHSVRTHGTIDKIGD